MVVLNDPDVTFRPQDPCSKIISQTVEYGKNDRKQHHAK
jgi:hypothetical protein